MFFGGAPLWHVSVAMWSRLTNRPRPVASLPREAVQSLEAAAAEVLAGIGIEDRTRAELFEIALHMRRETTSAERDQVFATSRGKLISARHERG
jgi:hypothetical protein